MSGRGSVLTTFLLMGEEPCEVCEVQGCPPVGVCAAAASPLLPSLAAAVTGCAPAAALCPEDSVTATVCYRRWRKSKEGVCYVDTIVPAATVETGGFFYIYNFLR